MAASRQQRQERHGGRVLRSAGRPAPGNTVLHEDGDGVVPQPRIRPHRAGLQLPLGRPGGRHGRAGGRGGIRRGGLVASRPRAAVRRLVHLRRQRAVWPRQHRRRHLLWPERLLRAESDRLVRAHLRAAAPRHLPDGPGRGRVALARRGRRGRGRRLRPLRSRPHDDGRGRPRHGARRLVAGGPRLGGRGTGPPAGGEGAGAAADRHGRGP